MSRPTVVQPTVSGTLSGKHTLYWLGVSTDLLASLKGPIPWAFLSATLNVSLVLGVSAPTTVLNSPVPELSASYLTAAEATCEEQGQAAHHDHEQGLDTIESAFYGVSPGRSGLEATPGQRVTCRHDTVRFRAMKGRWE